MDKALVFGTKDCRFESSPGHDIFMYLCGMHITTEPRDQLLYPQDTVMHVKSDESTWRTTTTTTTRCRVTMKPPTKRNAPFMVQH